MDKIIAALELMTKESVSTVYEPLSTQFFHSIVVVSNGGMPPSEI
jgi:hypothetical protein